MLRLPASPSKLSNHLMLIPFHFRKRQARSQEDEENQRPQCTKTLDVSFFRSFQFREKGGILVYKWQQLITVGSAIFKGVDNLLSNAPLVQDYKDGYKLASGNTNLWKGSVQLTSSLR
jgi:hypothetical protein